MCCVSLWSKMYSITIRFSEILEQYKHLTSSTVGNGTETFLSNTGFLKVG